MMFSRLADLAQRRGKRVLVLAAVLFVAAAAFGAGVADHLAPYGADDPDTESVRADDVLEDAGYRGTGLVVLVDGVDVVHRRRPRARRARSPASSATSRRSRASRATSTIARRTSSPTTATRPTSPRA